jgi:uncharacterized protein
VVRLTVRVRPGARVDNLQLQPDGGLLVHVRAPAVDGRANEATIAAIASALGLRPRQVQLVRGARARSKLIDLDLESADELQRRLRQVAGQVR